MMRRQNSPAYPPPDPKVCSMFPGLPVSQNRSSKNRPLRRALRCHSSDSAGTERSYHQYGAEKGYSDSGFPEKQKVICESDAPQILWDLQGIYNIREKILLIL